MKTTIRTSRCTRHFLLLFLLLLSTHLLKAQFTVNGSFELYTAFPVGLSHTYGDQVQKANGWSQPTLGSSDYFHRSATRPEAQVPVNYFGTQETRTSIQNAYGGIVVSWGRNHGAREYLQYEFDQPLIAGHCYKVRFYVNKSDNSPGSLEHIGAYFSTRKISENISTALGVTPQLVNTSPVTSSTDWVLIEGCVCVPLDSMYTHVIIGNFESGAPTLADGSPPVNNEYIYYYVDELSVDETAKPGFSYSTPKCNEPIQFTGTDRTPGQHYKWIIKDENGQELASSEDIDFIYDFTSAGNTGKIYVTHMVKTDCGSAVLTLVIELPDCESCCESLYAYAQIMASPAPCKYQIRVFQPSKPPCGVYGIRLQDLTPGSSGVVTSYPLAFLPPADLSSGLAIGEISFLGLPPPASGLFEDSVMVQFLDSLGNVMCSKKLVVSCSWGSGGGGGIGTHKLGQAAAETTLQFACNPNPFSSETEFSYTLPLSGSVRLHLYDGQGRLVEEVENTQREAGSYQVAYQNKGLAPGVYTAKLITAHSVKAIKVIIR
jgi:hypothetical protein